MKCFIDAGNTRIKWQMGARGVVHAQPWEKMADWGRVLAMSAEVAGGVPDTVVIAAVVGAESCALIEEAIDALWPEATLQWLSVRSHCCGLRTGYRDPAQLGVDRYCALVAAHSRFKKRPVVVISLGTALTVDLIQADGQHAGGMIMPGTASMLAGLAARAPALGPAATRLLAQPLEEMHDQSRPDDESGLGRDTATALALGCRWMLLAALRESVQALGVEQSEECAVVLAGGEAERAAQLLDEPVTVVPDLVLEGAVLLAQHPH